MVYRRGCRQRDAGGLRRSVRSFELPREVLNSRIEDFYAALDCPLALSCFMLFKYGEHEQLAKKDIDPNQYIDADVFRRDYSAVAFLSKYPGLETGIDTKAAALASFRSSEEQCRMTNARLRSERLRTENRNHELVLSVQARLIARILGDVDVESILEHGSFGPGTTFSLKGQDTSSSRKYAEGCDITLGAYLLFGETMKLYSPSWTAWQTPNFVSGNSVSTVPKNAKTDRTIAMEPSLNVWLQLAVGREIRSKLRSFGYDLDSDVKNRRYALLGARKGLIATLDFRSASNTIACAAVERLLPPRWFLLLDACRSHNYLLDKKWSRSEVFSTMGNGFTFELESLIFVTSALAMAEVYGHSGQGISIFGDDLTCSVEMVPHLTEYITYLGFELNEAKSYSSGYFRESCGDHYFGSLNCKPLLLRNRVKTLAQLYDLSNRLLLLAHRHCAEIGLDRRFRALWHRLLEAIPKELRFFGPASYGASVLFTDRRPEELSCRRHKHWDGWVFQHLSAKAITIVHDGDGHLLARLRGNERRPNYDWDVVSGRLKGCLFIMTGVVSSIGNDVPLRGVVSLRVNGTGFSQQWYDFGHWY